MKHRVTFITDTLAHGGAEIQLLRLLSRYPADFDITVILFSDGSLNAVLESYGIRSRIIHRIGKSQLAFIFALCCELRRCRPDVVHTWKDGTAGTMGRLAALLVGCRRIIHSDRSVIGHPQLTSRLQRSLRPVLDRLTTLFLPNSRPTEQLLLARRISAQRIQYLPNSLDLQCFMSIPVRPAPLTLGFLGKFRPEKRPELLLKALRMVPVEQRPARVRLAGDGPLMSELEEELTLDSWLSNRVELPGLIEDVPAFLKTLDYLVLCSDFEGTPNVVLEAMACGLPIIATNVAGLDEILRGRGETVSPGNARALAAAIVRMEARSQDERALLGLRGQEYVRYHHDVERNAALFWELHRQVVEGQGNT